MKFLFYPEKCVPFHRHSLEERPLGGTETGVIGLSTALAGFGHQVYVVSYRGDDMQDNLQYITADQLDKIGPVDVYVVVRNWKLVFSSINYKKCFYWSGDSYCAGHVGIGEPNFYNHVDAMLCVSEWHANNLCNSSGFPKSKTWILRNGVFLSRFSGEEKRIRKRLIYTTIPARGLFPLSMVFALLLDKHPDMELHLFSSTAAHRADWLATKQEEERTVWGNLLKVLGKQKRCFAHGSILQQQLAREFMRSAIWAYPTNSLETSCVSAMEAQAAGCACITSDLAGLHETVGDAGILLKEPPGSQEYLMKFVEETDKVLSDDALLAKLSQASLEHAKGFDWKTRAQSFLDYLKSQHGLE